MIPLIGTLLVLSRGLARTFDLSRQAHCRAKPNAGLFIFRALSLSPLLYVPSMSAPSSSSFFAFFVFCFLGLVAGSLETHEQ